MPFLAYFEPFWISYSIAHNPKVVGSSPAPATLDPCNKLLYSELQGFFISKRSNSRCSLGIKPCPLLPNEHAIPFFPWQATEIRDCQLWIPNWAQFEPPNRKIKTTTSLSA
jgi:hypothetical protein